MIKSSTVINEWARLECMQRDWVLLLQLNKITFPLNTVCDMQSSDDVIIHC